MTKASSTRAACFTIRNLNTRGAAQDVRSHGQSRYGKNRRVHPLFLLNTPILVLAWGGGCPAQSAPPYKGPRNYLEFKLYEASGTGRRVRSCRSENPTRRGTCPSQSCRHRRIRRHVHQHGRRNEFIRPVVLAAVVNRPAREQCRQPVEVTRVDSLNFGVGGGRVPVLRTPATALALLDIGVQGLEATMGCSESRRVVRPASHDLDVAR